MGALPLVGIPDRIIYMKTVLPFLLLGAAAIAETDPYANYVKLSRVDTSTTSSWNAKGGWSDGSAPSPAKNYLVEEGALLFRKHVAGGDSWNGGQLAIRGTLYVQITVDYANAPTIDDLVLLGGSEVTFPTYGCLRGTTTVAGTIENPARFTYPRTASTSNVSLRNTFAGAADSAVSFYRPLQTDAGAAVAYGSAFTVQAQTFHGYPGTVIVTGPNTLFYPEKNVALDLGGTLRVEDGATVRLYGNGDKSGHENMTAAGIDLHEGTAIANYDVASGELWPVMGLSGRMCVGDDALFVVTNFPQAAIVGITPANPIPVKLKVAHLTGDAAADFTWSDRAGLRIGNARSACPDPGWQVLTETVSGGVDVVLAYTNFVTVVDSSVAQLFAPGNEGAWSDPSKLHSGTTSHFCCNILTLRNDVNLPGATLSITNYCLFTGGSGLAMRQVNLLSGRSISVYDGDDVRTISGGCLNIYQGPSTRDASLVVFQGRTFNLLSEVCGGCPLTVKNQESKTQNECKGTLNLYGISTNFHGRLTVQNNPSSDGKIVRHALTTYLNDARNWGGDYAAAGSGFDAVTLRGFPKVILTNSVAFAGLTRNVFVDEGVTFDVWGGRTLTFGNQLTFNGCLCKTGGGTLDLAGTALFYADGETTSNPVEGRNLLQIESGALRVSSRGACDGLAVSFAQGSKLLVPADSECGLYDVKCDTPLTVGTDDGRLPVEIEFGGGLPEGDVEVVICTLNATAAAGIGTETFDVRKVSASVRCKGVEKRTNADGSVSYVATVGKSGMAVIIR